jgi:nitroimidazol reductase NimA-like FMN-containing flavoprotein (pyridoxamine 5'-phosphate oxidase superfamily)
MYLPTYEPPKKVGKLTEDEITVFLAQPWKARLATLTPEDTPYIVPVWYEYDAAQRVFYIVARERSSYVQHIADNPAVALHIADDTHLENTRILIEGTAEILAGPIAPAVSPVIREKATSMARKYMGDEGPEYAQRTMTRPRYLIKITPSRWHSWSGREWAARYRKE